MAKKTQLPSPEKAKLILEAVEDRLALDPIMLDLTGKTVLFDFAIICSGNSDTHIRAITNGVLEKTDEANLADPKIEGQSVNEWVLMDFGDVVLHILSEEARSRYKLETFWTTPQPKGALPPTPTHPGDVYAGSAVTDVGFNDSDEDEFDDDEMTDEELDALMVDDEDEEDAAFFDEADQAVEPIDEEDDDFEEETSSEAQETPKQNGK